MFILGIDMQKVRFLTLLVVVLLTAAIQFLSARGRMLFNKDTLRFCAGTSCAWFSATWTTFSSPVPGAS